MLHEMELREQARRGRVQAVLEGIALVAGLLILGYIWFMWATYGEMP